MKLICLRFISSMASSSRLPKHNWTKEEEAGLVEYLVELVNAVGGGPTMRRFGPNT